MPTSDGGHTRDNLIVSKMLCIRRFAMNITRLVGIVAVVGIGLAMAPAANADATHGAFAVRLGLGVPLDNNVKNWKDVDVISGFSYFFNHKPQASLMTGFDVDTQLHTKHGYSAHAMGITYCARQLVGNDNGGRNYIGLGFGVYRTEYESAPMSTEISTASTSTTGVNHFGSKAMVGRMDNRGRFVEATYTYTGTSISNGLSATIGLRF
jgi:hypothetical protein